MIAENNGLVSAFEMKDLVNLNYLMLANYPKREMEIQNDWKYS